MDRESKTKVHLALIICLMVIGNSVIAQPVTREMANEAHNAMNSILRQSYKMTCPHLGLEKCDKLKVVSSRGLSDSEAACVANWTFKTEESATKAGITLDQLIILVVLSPKCVIY